MRQASGLGSHQLERVGLIAASRHSKVVSRPKGASFLGSDGLGGQLQLTDLSDEVLGATLLADQLVGSFFIDDLGGLSERVWVHLRLQVVDEFLC